MCACCTFYFYIARLLKLYKYLPLFFGRLRRGHLLCGHRFLARLLIRQTDGSCRLLFLFFSSASIFSLLKYKRQQIKDQQEYKKRNKNKESAACVYVRLSHYSHLLFCDCRCFEIVVVLSIVFSLLFKARQKIVTVDYLISVYPNKCT